MKNTITNLLKNTYGIALMGAVLAGALVAVLYIIGFIAGGAIGEQLAIFGAKVMKYCITVAAIGSLVGMCAFYVEGSHELTMDSNK